jgi:hypothetical protein
VPLHASHCFQSASFTALRHRPLHRLPSRQTPQVWLIASRIKPYVLHTVQIATGFTFTPRGLSVGGVGQYRPTTSCHGRKTAYGTNPFNTAHSHITGGIAMALCADCEVLGQELAESYPPENLKYQSSRQCHGHKKMVGAIERYMCRTCLTRWIRDLRPSTKQSIWTRSFTRGASA